MTEKPLVDKHFLLHKFPGKGGWTYTPIPEILQSKNTPFGWVTVKGSIDGFKLKQYKLMPMGNGQLFLPVRAEIRKKIKKEAGDTVRIILYADNTPIETPAELIECFALEEDSAKEAFDRLKPGERKAYIDWIYSAKTEDTKAKRILEMMTKLQKGLK